MGGKGSRRVGLSIALALVTSCGGSGTTESTQPPQRATPAEMEIFCDAYEPIRNQSWGEITAALVEVSPAEIRTQMVRASQPPGDGWEVVRRDVESFLERCDDLS